MLQTEKELVRLTGAVPKKITKVKYQKKPLQNLPASVNYAEKGAVTRVKDQVHFKKFQKE